MIEGLLLLVQSNIGIAGVCFGIAFWVLKLHTKNQKLETEKSIDDKVSRKDMRELKEKLHNEKHEMEKEKHEIEKRFDDKVNELKIEITSLKK